MRERHTCVPHDDEAPLLTPTGHLRSALVLLWRHECTWVTRCDEESFHEVLTHVMAALRAVGGNEEVVAAMLDAERVRELGGRTERSGT